MSLIKIVCVVIILCFHLSIFSQSKHVSIAGIVYDENQEPLTSALVNMPGLNKSIFTDENGYFELTNIPHGSFSIEISLLGYDPVETKINIADNNAPFLFNLKRLAVSLESVSVYGYTPTQLANRQAYNVKAIDAQKLHNTTSDIAHILDRVPGARLRATGGVGSDFDFSINGFSGKRVKFFLDGVPIDDFGSSFQINNIPVNIAERVEVYKGVVPIWLGSDALGGAVNIITENKYKNYLDVSYSYGSFNTHRSSINTAVTTKDGLRFQLNAFQNYSDNDYKVTVDAADIHTGKYYPNKEVRRFHDKYHNETVIAQFGFLDKKWADKFLVGITLGQNYKEIQTGARLVAVFGAWHTKGNIVMPTLKFQKKDLFAKGLDLRLNANYNFGTEQNIDTVHARYGWLGDSIRYKGKGGEGVNPSLYKFRNNIANVAATLSYAIDSKQQISLNNVYSHFDRKGEDDLYPDERRYQLPQKNDKNILGVSYQFTASDKWNATLFTKYIHQYSHTTLMESNPDNPRDTIYTNTSASRDKLGYGIAVSYFIKPELQLKLSYEKTYRMPESEDIFGDMINKDANWNIKPESSDNINLGVNYMFRLSNDHRFGISATGLYYYAKDYVFYTFSTNQNKIVAQNLEGVSSTSFESEVRYSYKRLITAGFNMTYQNIRNMQKYVFGTSVVSDIYKERIPNIPYFFGNGDISVSFGNIIDRGDRMNIGYNLLYVHDFFLYWPSKGNTSTKYIIPEQFAHDVNLTYTLKEGRYNISLECKNITNKKLYDNFSLQKPGRSFYAKLRYFIGK